MSKFNTLTYIDPVIFDTLMSISMDMDEYESNDKEFIRIRNKLNSLVCDILEKELEEVIRTAWLFTGLDSIVSWIGPWLFLGLVRQ